ncbi:uncharacterized protein MEPE_05516 [Melanopsichium pennsylvanicum]|uniref:Uncharacterized protein n=2 Tax=Melanopsichium pennsylvanicum TaxID=63383 RepID=A0AAJ5C7D6_9BASI|nr:uncharacterized protein BN887_04050 [Melanopsichium pennsylvanicum 4]SNX86807.1 uncharacterized protein MEPE_05516 [Melanopsichium pennsylvanicum]
MQEAGRRQEKTAKKLIAKLQVEHDRKDQGHHDGVQRGRNRVHFTQNQDLDNKPDGDFEILLDDMDWIDLHARSMPVWTTWGNRAVCKSEGKSLLPPCWSCNPSAIDIVDHVSGNTFDYRRSYPNISDCCANAQNIKRGDGNGSIGVHWIKKRSRWVVQTRVKEQHRTARKLFED